MVDAFSETLVNSLLLHHAFHEESLNKESFEYAMKGCAEAGGRVAELDPGRVPYGHGLATTEQIERLVNPGTRQYE